MKNVLFVCSMNQWRSPTAENVFAKHPQINARSAGTNRGARVTVKAEHIEWADIVCVMEQKHKQRIYAKFQNLLRYKTVHVLDIPDDYQFMDPELIQIILEVVEPLLELESNEE